MEDLHGCSTCFQLDHGFGLSALLDLRRSSRKVEMRQLRGQLLRWGEAV